MTANCPKPSAPSQRAMMIPAATLLIVINTRAMNVHATWTEKWRRDESAITVDGLSMGCSNISGSILSQDFNASNDVTIKCFQILCRNPILLMLRASYCVNFVLLKKSRAHSKASHVTASRCVVFCIPITCYLRGVRFAQHRIVDELFGQARRKSFISALFY